MPLCRRDRPLADLGMNIALLKKEHKVFLFDLNNEIFLSCFKARSYWKYLHMDPDSDRDISFWQEIEPLCNYFASKILDCNPDVIVFEAIGNTFINSERMTRLLKEKKPNIPIIFIGLFHKSKEEIENFILNQKKHPQDFIIIGYEEIALPKLVASLENNEFKSDFKNLFSTYDKIIDATKVEVPENLDHLPFFDFTDFDLNRYKDPSFLEIYTSRGCIWRCKFCSDWQPQGKYRSMSGRRIFNEFINQSKLHKNVNHIRMVDLAINLNIDALNEFCDLIIEAKNNGMRNIFWSGDAIIHPGMTKELILKMRKAGCVGIGYGLESGSERVIKSIGKKFSIPLAEEVIKNTHNSGIKTSINIITGLPAETEKDFEQTINFINRNKNYIDEIRLTFMSYVIRKNSAFFEYAEKIGIKSKETEYWFTDDKKNTYEERIKRFDRLKEFVLSLGIDLRVGGRILKKAGIQE